MQVSIRTGFAIVLGIIFAFQFAMIRGGIACIEHYLPQWRLWQLHSLPWHTEEYQKGLVRIKSVSRECILGIYPRELKRNRSWVASSLEYFLREFDREIWKCKLSLFTLLMLGSGVFWTGTYLLIIRRSILDHTYGMPLAALGANISWEFLFSFIYPPNIIQHIVNLIWFSLDLIILIQLLRYGPREFPDLSKRVFYALVSLALATSFCAVLFVTIEFHDSGVYAAFGQNLMMSVLFMVMLYRRRSLRGQSISIALCKLFGTALASLAFFLYSALSHRSILLPFLYIAILVYDVIYVGMVSVQQRAMPQKLEMVSDQMEMHR